MLILTFCRLLGVGLGVASAPVFAAISPDYDTARAFGYALQRDYATEQSAALANRIDRDAMGKAVISGLSFSASQTSSLENLWTSALEPSIRNDLGELKQFTSLVVSRVLTIDHARHLECLIFDRNNRFHALRLRLVSGAGGKIGIDDIHFAGNRVSVVKGTRQIILVHGVLGSANLSDDEAALAHAAAENRPMISFVFATMAEGKVEQAFEVWNRLSPDFKALPFWADYRDRLAQRGSKRAAQQSRASASREDPGSAFRRLLRGDPFGSTDEHLQCLRDAAAETYGMPFIQVMVADVLLNANRATEAADIANDIAALNPFSGSAHLVAVMAEVVAQRPAKAIIALNRWSAVVDIPSIEQQLSADPRMSAFVASPEFTTWRNQSNPKPTAP